jgi:hypothetical protein
VGRDEEQIDAEEKAGIAHHLYSQTKIIMQKQLSARNKQMRDCIKNASFALSEEYEKVRRIRKRLARHKG